MITSTHAIINAEDAGAARGFLPDVLGLPFVDAHDGWLIFRLPPAELGVHPSSAPHLPHGRHELYFMCADIDATVEEHQGGARREGRGSAQLMPQRDYPAAAARTSSSLTAAGSSGEPGSSRW